MALHTLNNTVAKGFNQMAPPARTITVALDMSIALDTINIHTNQKATTDQHSRHIHEVHRKLHQDMQCLYNIQKPHIHTTSI